MAEEQIAAPHVCLVVPVAFHCLPLCQPYTALWMIVLSVYLTELFSRKQDRKQDVIWGPGNCQVPLPCLADRTLVRKPSYTAVTQQKMNGPEERSSSNQQ